MLSSDALLPDPAFPTLTAALDPRRAARAFASVLTAIGRPVSELSCTVERSRIKHGRKALLGYRLTGRSSDGALIDQRAMLALYPGGDPAHLPIVSDASRASDVQTTAGSFPIPQLGGEAWFFPRDRKVHAIGQLLSDRQGTLEVVHYVPEQGCTVRLLEPDGRVLFGKCRADDRGAAAVQFGADRFTGTGSLRLAKIVSHDPDARIVWQEAIAGSPLDPAEVIAQPVQWAMRIAESLRCLHSLPPPPLKRITFASAALTLTRRIRRTCTVLPDLALRLNAAGLRLAKDVPPAAPLSPAHGDLHPGNLLWDGKSFGLIDLDTAALAPRAFDHATLAAALAHKAIERGASDAAIAAMLDALRSGATIDEVTSAAFDWSLAASLLGERLYRCATRLKSRSPHVRSCLLEQAERLVQPHA